jgi:hypothetical protein
MKVHYIEIKKSRQLFVQRVKVDIVFVENVQISANVSAAMTHLDEGLCFNALLTMKVENSINNNNNNNSINVLMFDNNHKGQKRFFAEIETRSPCHR